jgi:hypothetical protein
MASDHPDGFRIRASQQLEGAFEAVVPQPLPAVERMASRAKSANHELPRRPEYLRGGARPGRPHVNRRP